MTNNNDSPFLVYLQFRVRVYWDPGFTPPHPPNHPFDPYTTFEHRVSI